MQRLGGMLPRVLARSMPSAVATASFIAPSACIVTGAPMTASVTAASAGGGAFFWVFRVSNR